MKFIIALLFLFNISLVSACEKPITFQAGPFFSTGLVIKFWSGLTQSIQEETGCKTDLIASPNFESYLQDLVYETSNLYLVPDHYAMHLINIGFIPILKSDTSSSIYLVSRKDLTKDNGRGIIGETISLPSKYTRAYLELDKWLKKHNHRDRVKLRFGVTHDIAVIDMMKGTADAVAMVGSIYLKLPVFVRENYRHIVLQENTGAFIIAAPHTSTEIITTVKELSNTLNFLTWSKVSNVIHKPFEKEFREQFEEFKKTMSNNAD